MIITVLPDDKTRQAFARVVDHSRWQCLSATSIDEARVLAARNGPSVIVTQATVAGRSWVDLVRSNSKIIVTDPGVNELLWAEVLCNGGYGVLAQPFDPKEVFRVVSLAWSAANRMPTITRPAGNFRRGAPVLPDLRAVAKAS